MKLKILSILLCCRTVVCAAESKSILFIVGNPNHGWNEHVQRIRPYRRPCGLSDGHTKHVALGHETELEALSNCGIGIVFLHYAVDGEPGRLNETLMKVIGG